MNKNWQMNDGTNHPVFPSPLGTEIPETINEATQKSLLDRKDFKMSLLPRMVNQIAYLHTTFDQYIPQMQKEHVIFLNGLWEID